MSLTIDASVWTAAADKDDVFHAASRDFLRKVVADREVVTLPAFAVIEVACALARRLRDGAMARHLAHTLMRRIMTAEIPVDANFLDSAEELGTRPTRGPNQLKKESKPQRKMKSKLKGSVK